MNHKGLDRERIVADDVLAGQTPFGRIGGLRSDWFISSDTPGGRTHIRAGIVQRVWPVLKASRPIAALRAESRLFSKSRFTVGGFAVDWEGLAEILRQNVKTAGQLEPPAVHREFGQLVHGVVEVLESIRGLELDGPGK